MFELDKTTARDVIFGSEVVGGSINHKVETMRKVEDDLQIWGQISQHQGRSTHERDDTQIWFTPVFFSLWQVVEMLSGGGEKKPTDKDCMLNQLGAPE